MITKLLKDIENSKDWEEIIFNMGCEIAGSIASCVFSELDKRLAKERDTKKLRIIDKRKKTLVTKFGSFTINRNYYRDNERKKYRFLLDEKLGIEKNKCISPRLRSLSTILATLMPFRSASFCINSILPKSAAISHQTIHSSLQKEAAAYDQAQKDQTKALFEDGLIPSGLKQKEADSLFVEADGCWINLQREVKKDTELKLGVAYEGLKKIVNKRYQTINKTVFSGIYSSQDFWQGLTTKLNYKYKMNKVAKFFLGGDGASWIKAGTDYFKRPKFYLDKFHINQALKKAFSGDFCKISNALQAIEAGLFDEVLILLKQEKKLNPKRKEEIERITKYLSTNKDYLIKEADVKGLGAMEGNVDKILANRFKKRGMSWRINGAHNMAKMIELRLMSPVDKLICSYEIKVDETLRKAIKSTKTKFKPVQSDWLDVSLPVFTGPHSDRLWVKTLKEVVYS